MASDYGLNFGFRRSDESLRVSEGRFKTPTGEAGIILLGTCVEINPDETDGPLGSGRLRQAAAGALPRPGICGLLLQEEIMFRSLYEFEQVDSFQVNKSKPDALSVITNGPGVKVWFRNTPQQNRADGRVIEAVTIVDLTGVSVGTQLGWDGTTWSAVAPADAAQAHMEATYVDADNGFVEATLLR